MKVVYKSLLMIIILNGCTFTLFSEKQINKPVNVNTVLNGNENTITINWDKVSSGVSYVVQEYDSINKIWINIISKSNLNSFIQRLFTDETIYDDNYNKYKKLYRVKAYDDFNESEWSDVVSQEYYIELSDMIDEGPSGYSVVFLGNNKYQLIATVQNTGNVRIDYSRVDLYMKGGYQNQEVIIEESIYPGDILQITSAEFIGNGNIPEAYFISFYSVKLIK